MTRTVAVKGLKVCICGCHSFAKTRSVLLSSPPTHIYMCNNCGKEQYIREQLAVNVDYVPAEKEEL